MTYVGRKHCGEMCFVPASALRDVPDFELRDDVVNSDDDSDDDDGYHDGVCWIQEVVCVAESHNILWLLRRKLWYGVLEICLDMSRPRGRVEALKEVVPWTRGKARTIPHNIEDGLTVSFWKREDAQFPEVYSARTMRHQWMVACVRASQQASSMCKDAKFAKVGT